MVKKGVSIRTIGQLSVILACCFSFIMRIVIAGAGEVGTHLAKMLSSEEHDLVVIDNNPDRLKAVGAAMDVLTLEGNANSIVQLKEAKINKADLFIGVTFSEAVNVNAAILCKRLGAKKNHRPHR